MTGDVTLPFWLFALILLFAAVTAASHVVGPSVRWFFRRRMERVVARLNTRLARPIEPFKLAYRHDTIQRLIYDPKVIAAVHDHAREMGIPENVAFQEARAYAREIVPSFSATAYFGIGSRLARFLSETMFRVRLAHIDEAALAAVGSESAVVFVMNHRSNMDYVLVTYMASGRTALSYAVGEWARVWPLSVLIRSMGAYFIRRKSRNALYRRVLARYVQIATAEKVTQAVFPEGGLSLDGQIAPPKLGLLSYIIDGWREAPTRDIVFVPVAINYDRVLEDRVLVDAGRSGARRFRFSVLATFGYFLRRFGQWLVGRFKRFGYASVSFGAPLSLADLAKGIEGDPTEAVATHIMTRIAALVPVLPVPLVASVLVDLPAPVTRATLLAEVTRRIENLRASGAYLHVPRDNPDLLCELALKSLRSRKIIVGSDDSLMIPTESAPLLAFYAASIRHLLDPNRLTQATLGIELSRPREQQ